MVRVRVSGAAAVLVACGVLSASAGADPGPFITVEVDAPGAVAKGSRLHGTITLRNPLQVPVTVELRDRTGQDVGLDVPERPLSIAPGASAAAPFVTSVRRMGGFVVRPRAIVRDAAGVTLGITDGTLGVRRTRAGVRPDSGAATSHGRTVGHTTRWHGPYRDLDGVDPLEVADLAAMVKDGGLSESRDVGVAPPPEGGDPPYDPGPDLDALRAPWTGPTGPDDIGPRPSKHPTGPGGYDGRPSPFARVNPVPKGCIGGKLVIRTEHGPAAPSKEMLGGFGWSAMVDIYDPDAPLKLVRTQRVELDSLGEWDYCPHAFSEINAPFRYHYESINRYIAVLDEADHPHRIVPPPSGGPHDGHLPFGDKSDPVKLKTLWFDSSDPEGAVDDYGVGDMVRWGMEWVVSLAAAGVDPDPVHDEEADDQMAPLHVVVFPNTLEDCSGVSTCFKYPETNRVYVGAANQFVDPFVIKHELSHSLNYHAWNALPGSGSHGFEFCYSRELSAAEGFADFLAVWVDYPDSAVGVDTSGYYHFGPETPHANCDPSEPAQAGLSNEVWVAGALWDLADHHADFADVTGTSGWGAIPRTWLGMPYLTLVNGGGYPGTISAFEQHYKGKIDAKWHSWVTGVFDQNKLHF